MALKQINFMDMTVGEVEQRVSDLKAELFRLRFRNGMKQLDNPLTIRYLRRDIARCETALSEHHKGIRSLAGDSEAASES